MRRTLLPLLITTVFFSISTFFVFAQNKVIQWANAIGGPGNEEITAIVSDKDGNIYVSGSFVDTVDFDPGPDEMWIASNANSSDFFIQKLDQTGSLIWVKTFGGSGFDDCQSITTDKDGNLLATGVFSNVIDMDPGLGVSRLISAGFGDTYVVKFDSDGQLIWAKRVGSNDLDGGYEITTDSEGNVLVTGYFLTTVDFNPGPEVFNLTSLGGFSDPFLLKLDQDGDFVWARRVGGSGDNFGFDVVVDNNSNVYTHYLFSETIDLDPDGLGFNMTSKGGEDAAIVKVDKNGDFVWAKQIGGTGSDRLRDMEVDGNGDLISIGSYRNVTDFDPGPGVMNFTSNGASDMFVQKLNTNGQLIWAGSIGGPGEDRATAVEIDTGNHIFLVGFFNGEVDFDPGPDSVKLMATGPAMFFFQELDDVGDFEWVYFSEGSSPIFMDDLLLTEDESIYACGNFLSDTLVLDPNTKIASQGGRDVFVSRWNECQGSLNTLDTTSCDSIVINGEVFNKSGMYEQTLTNQQGCDSVLSIELTILQSTSNTLSEMACDSIVINGEVFNKSGMYEQTLTNQQGCDSVLSIELTILQSTSNTLSEMACDSIVINGEVFNKSGMYEQTLTNQQGCDSVLSIELTILQSTSNTLSEMACDSIVINGEVFNKSGMYEQTLTNQQGCDSVLSIDLKIIDIDTTVERTNDTLISKEAGASYQWLDCNNGFSVIAGATDRVFVPSSSGGFAVEITKNNCIDTSGCYEFILVHTEAEIGVGILIFPNPSTGLYFIEYPKNIQKVRMDVFDMLGKHLQSEVCVNSDPCELTIMSPPGTYIIELKGDKVRARFKVIKD